MRLDKYLKVSRVIKRRTVANEICDAGRVLVNNRVARASHEVKTDDVVEVAVGGRTMRMRVLSTEEKAGKDASREMYEALD